MKFRVLKASDWNYVDKLEITSLEELMKFIEKNGHIILDKDTITIYDYYVE